jgi:hypothetical protein
LRQGAPYGAISSSAALELYEGLTIGASLSVGRAAAMKVAQVNVPNGRAYADAFATWKRTYKFPEGKEAKAFYDDCIVCAEHRETADSIIAGLSIADKARVGVSGLAKRVRARLREDMEGPPPPSAASAERRGSPPRQRQR